jgi:hypothetical protein
MTVRNFVEKTKNDYIRHVKEFGVFLGCSPHLATPDDLRSFQVRQSETGVRPPTIGILRGSRTNVSWRDMSGLPSVVVKKKRNAAPEPLPHNRARQARASLPTLWRSHEDHRNVRG